MMKKQKVQLIRDAAGDPEYAVLSYSYFQKLRKLEDAVIPHAIMRIMQERECSAMTAWRVHRHLDQYEMAHALGITQGAVAQVEAVGNTPRKTTREKWAEVLGCNADQLITPDATSF
ncbi:helix-turn-helix domain-containing protein [Pseudomonas sp. HK3]